MRGDNGHTQRLMGGNPDDSAGAAVCPGGGVVVLPAQAIDTCYCGRNHDSQRTDYPVGAIVRLRDDIFDDVGGIIPGGTVGSVRGHGDDGRAEIEFDGCPWGMYSFHIPGRVLDVVIDTGHALAYGMSLVIDERLTTGRGHYYNRAGELLTTLDQVVHAMVEGDLA